MLKEIYRALDAHYGDLHWWPAETPFEVIAGAVLTQNTAWGNVEKALARFEGRLTPEHVMALPSEDLQEIIRPAGFYRQKAAYLKAVTAWFLSYQGDADLVRRRPLDAVRSELLQVRGVGNETADSILLYAFDFPTFVVDAYTMRLFRRFPVDAGKTYEDVKRYCEAELPRDAALYRQCHALIVQNGKDHCKKKRDCAGCPLSTICGKVSEPRRRALQPL